MIDLEFSISLYLDYLSPRRLSCFLTHYQLPRKQTIPAAKSAVATVLVKQARTGFDMPRYIHHWPHQVTFYSPLVPIARSASILASSQRIAQSAHKHLRCSRSKLSWQTGYRKPAKILVYTYKMSLEWPIMPYLTQTEIITLSLKHNIPISSSSSICLLSLQCISYKQFPYSSQHLLSQFPPFPLALRIRSMACPSEPCLECNWLNAIFLVPNYQRKGVSTPESLLSPITYWSPLPASPQLPDPSSGTRLSIAVIGRGTQNYTCAPGSKDKPKLVGAVASLYDASCLAAYHSSLLHELTGGFLQWEESVTLLAAAITGRIASEKLFVGHHYFSDETTPVFDFRINGKTDIIFGQKKSNVSAPDYSVKGVNKEGFGAIDWLKLESKAGTVGIKVRLHSICTHLLQWLLTLDTGSVPYDHRWRKSTPDLWNPGRFVHSWLRCRVLFLQLVLLFTSVGAESISRVFVLGSMAFYIDER